MNKEKTKLEKPNELEEACLSLHSVMHEVTSLENILEQKLKEKDFLESEVEKLKTECADEYMSVVTQDILKVIK
ncbi:MAG: hypothetical protein ACPG9K_01070 [Poseidonibacter sp.]